MDNHLESLNKQQNTLSESWDLFISILQFHGISWSLLVTLVADYHQNTDDQVQRSEAYISLGISLLIMQYAYFEIETLRPR